MLRWKDVYFLFSGQETLSMTEDFAIDIPQVCDYFGEIFGKFLSSGYGAIVSNCFIWKRKHQNQAIYTYFCFLPTAPCLNDNAVSLQRLWDLSRFAENKSADVFASILAKAAKIIVSIVCIIEMPRE